MIKRYLVFAFDNYYPSGGWGDFASSFDTLEEAKGFAIYLGGGRADMAEVVDSETMKEVGYSYSGKWEPPYEFAAAHRWKEFHKAGQHEANQD